MLALSLISLAALASASPMSVGDYTTAFKVESRGTSTTLLTKFGFILTCLDTIKDVDVTNFNFYAEHSGAAYCNAGAAIGDNVNCGGNCPTLEGSTTKVLGAWKGLVTGIGGYVSVDEKRKEIVFSVRGSTNLRNWIANLNMDLEPTTLVSGGKVHDGFNTAWNEMSAEVMSTVKAAAAKYPGFKIVATGHSLGGAVATIGAGFLRKAGHAIDIYTFGAPRSGNGAFADFISAQPGNEFRVTHRDDPVPRLPPIFLGYRHTSPEYWLSETFSDRDDYPLSEIKMCEGNANVACNAGTFGFDILTHNTYFGAISACGTIGGSKRTDDAQLEAKVNAWTQKDLDFINNRP